MLDINKGVHLHPFIYYLHEISIIPVHNVFKLILTMLD
jgi:hypothetical protein|nr:MAG TPA: hypothetical protein [Caudoviricetes sp.]